MNRGASPMRDQNSSYGEASLMLPPENGALSGVKDDD
jgi:hypothetical protein